MTEIKLSGNPGSEPSGIIADKLATYRVGTLQYTKVGLAMLFFWLLWGDFCFTLMESVIPTVLPYKLESLKSPNWVIGLIMTTIPSAMNFMINPIISFRSDRYRSRWGRRIPFLVFATPFVTLFLILMGFGDSAGELLHRSVVSRFVAVSPTVTILALIGVLMVCFQFFNMFIATVYYYLFNDVVPEAFLARCLALFRVFGSAASSFYMFVMFPFAKTHMREIFLGAAVLYFIGFTLMCVFVREGKYPPPPKNLGGKTGILAAGKTYFVECFSHRFYWNFFLMNALWQLSGCVGAFNFLYCTSLGLTEKNIGYVGGAATLVTTLLLYPAGIISDRLHPLRVMLGAMVGLVLTVPMGFIFLFYDFPPRTVLIIYWMMTLIILPANLMYSAASFPMYMRLLPKDRFGQFGSADAMVRSITMIFGGIAVGLFMDLMKNISGGNSYFYRFIPFWQFTFQLIALGLMVYLYRGWKRLGGLTQYVPPDTGVDKPQPTT